MEIKQRRAVSDKLKKYNFLADEDSFIEVTEWSNCEGYDISINANNQDKLISLTYGELEAINYLVKTLEHKG